MAMTIGQMAAGAGVNIQTVRYYERRGLLPRAPRTASGPNVETAREQLRNAFATIGEVPVWDEWDREADGVPSYVKKYGCPTILVDEQDIDGQVPSPIPTAVVCIRMLTGAFCEYRRSRRSLRRYRGRTVAGAAERHPNQKGNENESDQA